MAALPPDIMWRMEDEILVDFIHTYAVTLQRANVETCANGRTRARRGGARQEKMEPSQRCAVVRHILEGLGSAEPAKAGPAFRALMTGRTSWLPAA